MLLTMLLDVSILLLLVVKIHAQTPIASELVVSALSIPTSSVMNLEGESGPTGSSGGDYVPTGSGVSYISYSTTTTPNATTALSATTFAVANESSQSTSTRSRTTTSYSYSLLQGSVGATATSLNGSMTGDSTASRTSSSSTPTNTTPCNNYPEFCNRKYSNITMVAAHNSPFVKPNNAAANQELGVFAQLNDGIRMLQGQTHYNATTKVISYCHTSCDLLDAGTAESYFTDVTTWIERHPYDVVTILIGNSDLVAVGNYTSPLESSGLSRYAYVPSQVPMTISSWPTLGSMIISGKRAVVFMDYNANQTEVPYILDEFSQMWETPFSPTNRTFPCTQERPPDLDGQDAEQRMYMANHNLNTEISLAGTSLLVPTTALINETNAINGTGSLGLAANKCAATWSRPPNFLLVDYFNQGSSPGSVFEVAAQQNNVTYDRACCGLDRTAGSPSGPANSMMLMMAISLGVTLYSM